MESRMKDQRLAHLVSSDEAPDTGDDSDEDLVTNYLNNGPAGSGTNGGTDNLVPSIHITPQSPNGNHVLEDSILQISRIQDRIQEMRISNAQANLEVNNSNQKNRLSTSCPSLNDSADPMTILENYTDNNTSRTDNSNNHRSTHIKDRNQNLNQRQRRVPGDQINTKRKTRPQQGRHRSVSVSSGDSDDEVDGTASSILRQRSASTAPKEGHHQSATPPTFKDSRFFHGNRHKGSHLSTPFSSLHKSVSTPSIVVDQNLGHQRKKHRDLPEPTHVFLQRLLREHEPWTRPSGSDSDTDEEPQHASSAGPPAAVRSASYLGGGPNPVSNSNSVSNANNTRVRPHPLAAQINSTPSPQLSLAEFLQDGDPNLEDDDSRKRRRKKERSSLFFRKKKDKGISGTSNSFGNSKPPTIQHPSMLDAQQQSKSLAKVSSSSAILNKQGHHGQGSKIAQHSSSMSNLRKASISGPTNASVHPINAHPSGGSNSNFYLAKSEYGCLNHHHQHRHYHKRSLSAVCLQKRAPNFFQQDHAQTRWRRVGQKLGVIKNYDERDDLGHEDTAGLLDSEFIPGEEFVEGGGPAAIRDLETPKYLRIEEDEPETWTQTVTEKTINSLSQADVKRQENIYEFILTEKNHCQVLQVMQKIFVEGMKKYLSLTKEIVDRIFPCLETLIDLHFKFLEELRARQYQAPIVETISDLIYTQFYGENGDKWCEAYGNFCSCHNEAISIFKDLMKSDRRFQQFIRQCSDNPLLKKKGVPECILFVTTRITKYPLLIESLIKAAQKDRPSELEVLKQANNFVKDILKDINARVAAKERHSRLLEIYNKLDPKHSITFNGRKFKKSDFFQPTVSGHDRKLMFEGKASMQVSRSRTLEVIVVVLSDILFFLQETNQKYSFIHLENKPNTLAVQSLIAQERSGSTSKALNLISVSEFAFDEEPEVYELDIIQPPTRDDWFHHIKEAVDAADNPDPLDQIQRKKLNKKYLKIKKLTANLRDKDIELGRTLESKMKITNELMINLHGEKVKMPIENPDYLSLVRENKDCNGVSKEQLLTYIQEASRLASSIYSNNSTTTNLSGKPSASPLLPRRAETFSGFDKDQKPKIKEIDFCDGGEREISIETTENSSALNNKSSGNQAGPRILSMEPEQQQTAIQMSHLLNNLTCMVAEHFTTLESIKTELSEIREKATLSGGRYKQNQKFEEMRRLQDTLAQEKKEWNIKKQSLEAEEKEMKAKMAKDQAEIDDGLKDVNEQREQLYRKLEVLQKQGIELGPNSIVRKTDSTILTKSSGHKLEYNEMITPSSSPQSISSTSLSLAPGSGGGGGSASGSSIRKSSSLTSSSAIMRGAGELAPANSIVTGGSLKKESLANLHLMSATNSNQNPMKPMLSNQEIKQQIPVKLSSLSKETKTSKKSTVNLASSASLSGGSSSSSKGITNLVAKPEAVQQLLPFKLSEDGTKVSPKHHQKSDLRHQHQQQQYYQHHAFDSRRSGSPPQPPLPPNQHGHHHHGGSLRYTNSTLPKTAKTTVTTNYGSSSGANSDDDKVIYF